MTSTGPTLNLTYDELLEEIRSILRAICRHNSSPRDFPSPLDAYDRGRSAGAITLWHSLALSLRAPGRNCDEDRRQLELLAGLIRDSQEPPADGR